MLSCSYPLLAASNPELGKHPIKMKEKIIELSAKDKIEKDDLMTTSESHNRILQSPVRGEINLDGTNSPGDFVGKNAKDFVEWLLALSNTKEGPGIAHR